MHNLTTSIKHFTTLNRGPGATWTEATKRKAPHKLLPLLAALDLVLIGDSLIWIISRKNGIFF